MFKYRFLFLLFSSLALISCGGGGSQYIGNWYHSQFDHYAEVKSDLTVSIRVCSVNDGYREEITGTISGDTLTIDSETFQLSREDDTLTVTNDSMGYKESYTLVESIPATCESDAIEITSVTPNTATESEPTSFTVEFDYRLASKPTGIIYLGFNTDEPTRYILTEASILLDQPETGSGTLSATVSPVIYEAPNSFAAYVNLSDYLHPKDEWFPLASNVKNITVNPAGKNIRSTGSTYTTGNSIRCGVMAFGPCQSANEAMK